ncbi:6,7-dimethyl-8-ribityllumazine synthase [Helicobacter pylori]|uniref:6,7-dimethyl-8-ribityllumazine synthase n=1 Tax=Helicobacter pylori TaxID=210 RepID=UPI0009809CDA|nr:6,7-dimethyl-8-ribityllumazine synthase [Helicobacter pylori]AQM65065.1 6,7-dimethyl-8-ribityllumazine synthase [Helicobacter pylori SS1]AQM71516.1 6,7-dimethyl-8-ribityllumazine synthase [Helicobacter pylori PMSS1]KAF0997156.1 6,7-dimethyl-8-ribityllumazine synthase [Helicobacter pylori SS1_190]KAF1000520.1 6,7-dimethyl-8-ribityllumazine synthase [Helicobacter pylori SS1]NHB21506.1 6,7-dimethyl-8-ribityllumazine synthase [Helicobacter pylori]
MRIIEGKLQLQGNERVAILTSRFNHIITDRLKEGAMDCFKRHGGDEELLDLVLVPGAYELPLILDKLLESGKYDGVCVLGAIIRGGTPHFDYVSAEATKGIASTMLKYSMPVSFGVLTTDNIEQAIERAGSKAGNKGFEAMSTLIELLSLCQTLKG